MALLQSLKFFLPRPLRNARHFFYAWWGAVKYRHPSEGLFVIGVTGTSGKSSTIYFLRQILELAGFKVGALSTLEFCVAGKCQINDRKMTMLGRTEIQRYLRQMADADCQIVLIETTSEGRLQHRHRFINYDMMVLTNLYPEHIEAHGSFENYKQAKLDLFRYLAACRQKSGVRVLKSEAGKMAVVHGNSEYANEFLDYNFDKKILFTAAEVSTDGGGLHFKVNDHVFNPKLSGPHNAYNLSAAITAARALKVDWPKIQMAVNSLHGVPGRIEFIHEAETRGFKVIVDYAFEPVAMQALYEVVSQIKPNRIIHVFGSTGGGRDKARRFSVGKFVGERADTCIVTNEDPYDDDPLGIMSDVAKAVREAGKRDNETLFIIPDRGEAIKKAVQMADAHDVVLITGKGSEQAMVVRGKLVPWDDREVTKKMLYSIYGSGETI